MGRCCWNSNSRPGAVGGSPPIPLSRPALPSSVVGCPALCAASLRGPRIAPPPGALPPTAHTLTNPPPASPIRPSLAPPSHLSPGAGLHTCAVSLCLSRPDPRGATPPPAPSRACRSRSRIYGAHRPVCSQDVALPKYFAGRT